MLTYLYFGCLINDGEMIVRIILGLWAISQIIFTAYVRHKKKRLLSVLCVLSMIGLYLFFGSFAPRNYVLSSPDKTTNIAISKAHSHHIKQHPEGLLWNPYIFSGMPGFASLTTSNIGVEHFPNFLAKNFFCIVFWLHAYICLRFKPSRFERGLSRFVAGSTDDMPNIVIVFLLVWAFWMIFRLFYVLINL